MVCVRGSAKLNDQRCGGGGSYTKDMQVVSAYRG